MRKLYCWSILLLFLGTNLSIGLAEESKTMNLKKEIIATLEQPGQVHTLIVPVEPLEFDTTLEWSLTIDKKNLTSEKSAAYMVIEPYTPDVRQVERYTASSTGSLTIPRGSQYKITLNAGEYSRLFVDTGAAVKLKISYDEVLVKCTEGDKAYSFDFEVLGPSRFKEWRWIWSNTESSIGKKLTHQFAKAGQTTVIIEGKGDSVSQKYHFELDVPPLVVLDPMISSLEGPVELTVTVKANSISNYNQKTTYTWNFGNGIELTGSEASTNYTLPGNYPLTLTAQVGEYSFKRSWLVKVTPLTIMPNPTVTPLTGPVPLEINAAVNPVIKGNPTRMVYTWLLNGIPTEAPKVKHILTEPGEYLLVLKTEDKLHPNLIIPDSIFVVKALPPQLSIAPSVTSVKGITPLEVVFNPNITVSGAPVDLHYSWDFGDGHYSSLEKPVHIFTKPGEYEVRLVVSDGLHLGNTVAAQIKVSVAPPAMKPEVTVNTDSGLIPLTVKFNAQTAVTGSPCEPQYFWNFGDGTVSCEQNPAHTYKYAGNYLVTLEVRDGLNPGSSVKTTLPVEARLPKLRLTVAVKPTSGKAPFTIKGQAWADKEGVDNPKFKFEWDFGDGARATGMDIEHIYSKSGTYTILVTVIDEDLGINEKKMVKVTVK